MRRREQRRPGHDTQAAIKAALDQLAQGRGQRNVAYPECLRLYADIRDEANRWLVRGVREAIERGCTWAQVGDALGTSRQAAHERYSPHLELAQDVSFTDT